MPEIPPHFQKPPVVETVLSVQFDRLNDFRIVHFGLLWQRIGEQFPVIEEQPPLPPFRELFGTQLKLPLEHLTQWSLTPQVQLPRTLYRKEIAQTESAGSEMIQVQPDRFIHNWARPGADKQFYPTYRVNRGRFLETFNKFSQFVTEQKIGLIRPNIVEVTYINRIAIGAANVEELVRQAFPGFPLQRSDSFLPPMESIFVNQSFPIAAERGRLHVHFKAPVLLRSDEEVIDLRLTALVAPASGDGSVEEALDLAHHWVVNGFRSMTSPVMHSQWGILE